MDSPFVHHWNDTKHFTLCTTTHTAFSLIAVAKPVQSHLKVHIALTETSRNYSITHDFKLNVDIFYLVVFFHDFHHAILFLSMLFSSTPCWGMEFAQVLWIFRRNLEWSENMETLCSTARTTQFSACMQVSSYTNMSQIVLFLYSVSTYILMFVLLVCVQVGVGEHRHASAAVQNTRAVGPPAVRGVSADRSIFKVIEPLCRPRAEH